MKKDKLFILWTSDNKETALNMILMYTLKSNQNNWWKECKLVTWGPSNQLLCKDPEVQALIKEIQAENVQVYACQRCAERYGLVDEIKALDIDVQLMGEPLTQCLQDPEWSVLSI
ncbi:MAG: DsrE family protein [Clostridia bacterium]|nr:DsrE family protein [Clostridia bacterium]